MDPHTWHKQSMQIDNDHPYGRPSYRETLTSICIEPKIRPGLLTEPQFGQEWIDVVDDDTGPNNIRQHDDFNSSSSFATFCMSPPLSPPSKPDPARSNSLNVTHAAWNITAEKLCKNMKKTLIRAALEESLCNTKDDELVRKSNHELNMRRLARIIRKTFTRLNWRIDACAEVHENLLATLPENQLLTYISAFACLMRQNKVPLLLRRLNNEMARRSFTRFPYAKYLEKVVRTNFDGTSTLAPKSALTRPQDGATGSYSPITFIPSNAVHPQSKSGGPSTSGRASTTEEAIFIVAVGENAVRGPRVTRILGHLSQIGRVKVESAADDVGHRVRRFLRSYRCATEEVRPTPIFFVGFGTSCEVVLRAATLMSPLLCPTAVALEDLLCGRAIDSQPAAPKPWLAGLVLIAPPPVSLLSRYSDNSSRDDIDEDGGGDGGVGNNGSGSSGDQKKVKRSSLAVANALRRCSLLVAVGDRWRTEARAFRETVIKARRRALMTSADAVSAGGRLGGVVSAVGLPAPGEGDKRKPVEYDLRLLLIGGADHLLRMHPTTLRRHGTNQAAIDLAIITAVKNLAIVCRNLVNTNAPPPQPPPPVPVSSSSVGGLQEIRAQPHNQQSMVLMSTPMMTAGRNGSNNNNNSSTNTWYTPQSSSTSQYPRRAAILRGNNSGVYSDQRHMLQPMQQHQQHTGYFYPRQRTVTQNAAIYRQFDGSATRNIGPSPIIRHRADASRRIRMQGAPTMRQHGQPPRSAAPYFDYFDGEDGGEDFGGGDFADNDDVFTFNVSSAQRPVFPAVPHGAGVRFTAPPSSPAGTRGQRRPNNARK